MENEWLIQFFAYEHLPSHLQAVSKQAMSPLLP
jgi:hypothetical protein